MKNTKSQNLRAISNLSAPALSVALVADTCSNPARKVASIAGLVVAGFAVTFAEYSMDPMVDGVIVPWAFFDAGPGHCVEATYAARRAAGPAYGLRGMRLGCGAQ